VYNKGKVRSILLPSALTEVLKEYVEKHHISDGIIFRDNNQQPVNRKNIWRHMKRIARYAGVAESKVFPHNLRHLFAKEFYRQTGDIMKLADVLGHSNVNTTRIYLRTTGREHKQQLDEMNMVMFGCDHRDYTATENIAVMNPATTYQNSIKTSISEGMYEIKIQIPLSEIIEMSLSEQDDIMNIMSQIKINS
jgi:hypothetical protein